MVFWSSGACVCGNRALTTRFEQIHPFFRAVCSVERNVCRTRKWLETLFCIAIGHGKRSCPRGEVCDAGATRQRC